MKEFTNKVLELKKEIEYAKGSIVSKIIYKGKEVISTLFALEKDQSIAEHVTPFDALVQLLEGEAEITIGSEKKVVKAGESIIMPINVPHALYATESFKMLLVMMK